MPMGVHDRPAALHRTGDASKTGRRGRRLVDQRNAADVHQVSIAAK
jgi:hypothetical protein